MTAKNTTYKNIRIAGYGLQALMKDDGSVDMIDSSTSEVIVNIQNPTLRITRQFETFTNYRAGMHSDSKMANILECLLNVPEMQNYF